MRIDVVTVFPSYFAPVQLSVLGRAISEELIDFRAHDLRNWAADTRKTVDDTPYGGGAGMVMLAEPHMQGVEHIMAETPQIDPEHRILLVPSAAGQVFDQRMAQELAQQEHLIFSCGRYEGIDARFVEHAQEHLKVQEVSIGDYVLYGGEVAALVIIEAVTRLLPGVLGNEESLVEESHANGLLEYPVYTKPVQWRGRSVPEVLLSGHHQKIAQWRLAQSQQRTAQRRPDLWNT